MRFGCRDYNLVALEHAHFVGYSGVGKLRGLIVMPIRINRPRLTMSVICRLRSLLLPNQSMGIFIIPQSGRLV